mmetsp:Transcript_7337/g.11588  ORF Transcript_7337/g.11588 Transcript_7337/m.11588 type:complete len:455 (+) Transcript_7337:4413-5777(+)
MRLHKRLLDAGRGRQRRALVGEQGDRRKMTEELALGGLPVHVGHDQLHRQALRSSRFPDDEYRDLVQNGDHDHEEVLQQRVVEGDAGPEVHVAHERPHHLIDGLAEDARVEIQPRAARTVLGHAAHVPKANGDVPNRLLELQVNLLQLRAVALAIPLAEPGVVAIGEGHEHRAAYVIPGALFDVEEVRGGPRHRGLRADALREELAEPAEDLYAPSHVAEGYNGALAVIRRPHVLLRGADELGEYLDEVAESPVALFHLLHQFFHVFLGYLLCSAAAARARLLVLGRVFHDSLRPDLDLAALVIAQLLAFAAGHDRGGIDLVVRVAIVEANRVSSVGVQRGDPPIVKIAFFVTVLCLDLLPDAESAPAGHGFSHHCAVLVEAVIPVFPVRGRDSGGVRPHAAVRRMAGSFLLVVSRCVLLLVKVNPKLPLQHSADVDLLGLGRESAEVVDVVYH